MSKKSGRKFSKNGSKGIKRSKRKKMARKRRDMPVPIWTLVCVLLLLTGGLAVWVWGPSERVADPGYAFEEEPVWRAGPGDLVAFADSMAHQSAQVLRGLGVPSDVIVVNRVPENLGSAMRWEVSTQVPGELPFAVCNLELTRLARRMGGVVLEARENREGNRLSMLVGLEGRGTNLLTLRANPNLARTAGRIAIIVDDFGYQDGALIEAFCALKQRVTMSIFPGFEQTTWIAEQAAKGGHGVMVHMPMEPIDYPHRDPGSNAIFADYSSERIRTLTRQALAAVPHARGLNNHMGSRVTQDREAIGPVLREVARYGFFFVDSVTSPHSVAFAMAQELGMPSGRNRQFLDRKETQPEVERALESLAMRARREGTVIGIGHAKSVTLAAFERMLPELESRGIEFITAAEAVR
jgi:polysaccharide deacetylase 2 family uncharacterized protein YibQ